MGISYNAIIFNGKSTADFDFEVAVLASDDYAMGSTKTQLTEINGRSGSVVRGNINRSDISKKYRFLLKYPTNENIKEFKRWLAVDKGNLVTYREKDTYYKVKKIEVVFSEKDDFESYEVEVTFICDPISYIRDVSPVPFSSNGTLELKGTAIAYPTITITGTTNNPTRLTIGNNTINFKSLNGTYVLDCSLERAGLFNASGNAVSLQWNGYFFVFNPLKSARLGVVLGQGISRVEIVGNWGYV